MGSDVYLSVTVLCESEGVCSSKCVIKLPCKELMSYLSTAESSRKMHKPTPVHVSSCGNQGGNIEYIFEICEVEDV